MANDTLITVVGSLTADPELRFAPSGIAVANFTIASNPRTFDKQTGEWVDGEAMFLNCSVWRQYAENVAESLAKGSRVIVYGRLKARSYETRDGDKRTVFEIEVEEIGPVLRFATARITRTGTSGGQASSRAAQRPEPGANPWAQGPASTQPDPWAAQSALPEEPPF